MVGADHAGSSGSKAEPADIDLVLAKLEQDARLHH
jgi:hypothetical protein